MEKKKPLFICAMIFVQLHYFCMSQKSDFTDYATPKGCLAFYTNDETGVALECEVQFVNYQMTNFSAIPTKYTQSIKLTCSYPFYMQSSLTNVSFPPFDDLKELVFIDCKFSSLSESDLASFQEHLLYLTVRGDHDDTSALLVDSSAIGNLRKLQALDLANNNMPGFPEQELCHLSDLQEVILRHNALTNITIFGFSGTCLQDDLSDPCCSNLEMLDLSHNQFLSLPSKSFCKTSNLKHLYFERNNISLIEDGAFSNLHSLQQLSLPLNYISSVGPKTWLGLEKLIFLNLSHNEISSYVDKATFQLLGELQTLDLSFNQIQTINNQSFMRLTNLTYLALSSNQIEEIDDGTFSSLTKLQVLQLQENRISTISRDTFLGVKNLKLLSLEGNNLSTVDEHAFQNCFSLTELLLGNNSLKTLPIISHLSHLSTLDLSTNKLDYLHNNSFVGLINLENLSLKHNNLGMLPENVFENLTRLSFLDLSENNLTTIQRNTFSNNLQLKSLKVQKNNLKIMFNLQLNLQLTDLDMSYNSLTMLIYGFLPISLKVFKADYNKIGSVEEVLYTASKTTITHMDLSYNALTTIKKTSLPTTLHVVNLDFNKISYIESYSFYSMKYLEMVSLQSNKITTMLQVSLTTNPEILRRPKVLLTGNSLTCSCDMLWIKTINGGANYAYAYINDLEYMYCWLPKRNQANTSEISLIVQTKETNFLCKFDEHIFTTNELCQQPPHCNLTCPNNCSCWRDQTWNTVIIVCSRANYTEVPRDIPVMSTAFYLDGNFISEIDGQSFDIYPKLQELYINASGLQTLSKLSFANMAKLRILHLENNSLQTLTVDVFSGLRNLEELYLFSNKLLHMHEEVFLPLVSLNTLRLQNNQLTNFPVSEFSRMPLLSSIALGKNPWSCDCDYVDKYHQWFQESAQKIIDIENLMCYPESEGEAISLINFNATFCMDQSRDYISYIPVIVSMTVIFIAIAGICVLIFIYRHEMQVLVYSRYGVRLLHHNREVNDAKKIYDAFISYSNDDEDLVVTKLLPKLEDIEFPYKLCLHQRDFAVGAFITESILEAVEYSRRTIMIMTESFVQSDWCRFEFKTAHMQMMKDKCNRVIVIVVGKIPKNLDPEMKLYLGTNTYLHWDDKLFWQKLYFALPEKRPKH